EERKWWALRSWNGPWGELGRIKVARDQTSVLKLGPPFTVHTDVRRSGRTVSIGLSLIGRAGEHWTAQMLRSSGPAAQPRLQIVDESEKVIASGKFEYG
ncbi:MAG: hypothetical protein ACYTBJ_19060, partial [Planctomycetota bacterium]